ncbi:cupin domain-containing protein [Bradyrhizobium jicamae]|uniref:Cupin domain-containing protein n=1 Tax=Bradyrhizobium jicamae TaxID=280332 RepID=A0ABS5FT05_9BRAD|nr:cupin domain-containing protein [Bradyrhizobium jicamae]MBR0799937.1 cupin domain-containing protein [Bradyrhizobium jicamae]
MLINDDLTQPVVVHAGKMDWIPSPAAGVDRRMLFRIGDEVARATSIVRYAPDSAFPRHVHKGGEEILVLDGVFEDEHGTYPAGSYFRNPPGTSHVPAAKVGCTIFVRLWQFRENDLMQIVRKPGEGQHMTPRPGASSSLLLFQDAHEKISLEDWTTNAQVTLPNPDGLEILVVRGGLRIGDEQLERQSWCRLPAGHELRATVGPEGATVWVREAALLHADAPKLPN